MADVITRFKAETTEYTRKVGQARSMLDKMGASGKQTGQILGQFDKALGINISSLGKLTVAAGAVSASLKVMKSAFFASEANLDNWNRAVYAGQSAWEAFLTSINTGDISGFLGKIDSIVNAAKEAYNEMDRLSTQKVINNPAVKAQEAENERFRAMLRTGRYIAPNDGRKAAMKEGQVLTEAQKKKIAQQLENGMAKLNAFVRSEIEQTTKSIDALYREQAKRLGMSLQEFRAGTANMGAFDQRMAGYEKYKQWEQDKKNAEALRKQFNYDRNKALRNGVDAAKWDRLEAVSRQKSNPYQQYKAWGVFKDDGELFQKINEYINQRASLQSQNYSNTANAYRAINRATGSGRSGGGSGSGRTTTAPVKEILPKAVVTESLTELQILEDQLKTVKNSMKAYGEGSDDWNAMNEEAKSLADQIARINGDPLKLVETSSLSQLQIMEDQLATIKASMENAANPEDWKEMADEAERLEKAIKSFKGDTDPQPAFSLTGNNYYKGASMAASGVGQIGSALQNMGVDLGEGFDKTVSAIQGVFTIIEGVQAIISAIQLFQSVNDTVQTGLLGTIAANTAVTATSSILDAIIPFHNGGIVHAAQGVFVPGTPNGGRDTVPAMLSPGELVLNRAQQQNLADQLQQGGGGGGYQGQPYVSGEKIFLGINAYLRRSGRGELITSKS